MILVIGRGYIGSAIAKELQRRDLGFSMIGKDADLEIAIRNHSLIINAAGYTGVPNVDACEKNKAECIEGNVVLPARIKELANGRPIVHVSSGCVFYGSYLFDENAEPNFDGSFYSATKIMAERVMQGERIVRIRMPFSLDGNTRCLIEKLRKYPKWLNGLNSISYVPDVAAACVDLLTAPAGNYHVVCPDPIWTHEIAKYLKVDPDYWMHDEFYDAGFTPRSFCTLSTKNTQPFVKLSSAHDLLRKIHEA